MAISEFSFGFEENGVYFDATCSVYDMPEHYKFPIYRVALNTHTIHPDVYLFYKTGKLNEPFFWYKTADLKHFNRWKIIAEALQKAAS